MPGIERALPRNWIRRKEDELTSQTQTLMLITVEDIIDELELIIIKALIKEPRYLF